MDKRNKPERWTKKLGWLKNKKRLDRRNAALTLTDEQVLELIRKIDRLETYTKLKDISIVVGNISMKVDELLRMRDKALIGTNWTWFKRANEILRIKFGNIGVTSREVTVQLLIEKKQKTFKICPNCQREGVEEKKNHNAAKANFCKRCGKDISAIEPVLVGKKPEPVVKRKNLNYIFCKFLVEWYEILKKLKVSQSDWVFPRYHYFSGNFLFDSEQYKPLSVQRYNQILQRLDPTMTSSMFRYGGAEKFLRKGYTPFEVKEIGDWSTSVMPELYAAKKGLTPSQKRFADDIEVE